MTVIWSRRAIRHLTALRTRIAKDSEESAAAVASRIIQAVELLQAQPRLGRIGRVSGTRELVVPGTPYIIPYSVRDGGLILLGVFHGRQQWPGKLQGHPIDDHGRQRYRKQR
jgi:addiction module RelE/StbE family toxin